MKRIRFRIRCTEPAQQGKSKREKKAWGARELWLGAMASDEGTNELEKKVRNTLPFASETEFHEVLGEQRVWTLTIDKPLLPWLALVDWRLPFLMTAERWLLFTSWRRFLLVWRFYCFLSRRIHRESLSQESGTSWSQVHCLMSTMCLTWGTSSDVSSSRIANITGKTTWYWTQHTCPIWSCSYEFTQIFL